MFSAPELRWFLKHLDEEQADSADGTDGMAWLGMLMPHLIYGCVEVQGQVLPQTE